MPAREFLTEEQEKHVINAIAEAERDTSAEIRVHLEFHCEGDALARADRLFHELGMDETRLQNGVLLYIATEDHKIAVYGGKEIDERVEEGFWQDVVDLMVEHFEKEAFEAGIAAAVKKTGSKLQELFPYHHKGSLNELTDEISYHDNREE